MTDGLFPDHLKCRYCSYSIPFDTPEGDSVSWAKLRSHVHGNHKGNHYTNLRAIKEMHGDFWEYQAFHNGKGAPG